MSSLQWLMFAIFAPVLCGVVTLALPRRLNGVRVAVALAGPIMALIGLGVVGIQPEPVAMAASWLPTAKLEFAFNPDHLGMFFALLVSGVGLLIVLYARAYFGPDSDSLYRFYPSLMLFMTAMIGVALADNFMLLLLFWEMTSISSFLLIGWERDQPGAVRNAMQAFITTALGGLVMMAGLILLGVTIGDWAAARQMEFDWTFSQLAAIVATEGSVPGGSLSIWAFGLIFVGAATKSAQFPFQFWLPGAMAAPTPVSAYLHSATMVKAGVYLVGRLWPIFAAGVSLWPQLIIPLGAITMVYGAFIALQKEDLKQIFAYTTVSQLGLLMTMYGLSAFEYHGEPNLIWDVTQILNHALYKAPLFILAGAIGHIASRNLPELKGFFYRGGTERIMAVVLLLAGYALAAGPLTLSFSAKEMFFYQIYHAKDAMGGWVWPLVLAGIATGMFNVAIFVRMAMVLLSQSQPEVPASAHSHDEHDHGHGEDAHGDAHGHGHGHGEHEHETGIWPTFLWIPGLLLVSFQYIGGIVPGAYEFLFGWMDPSKHYYAFQVRLGNGLFPMTWDAALGLPLYMSLAAMVLGVVLALLPVLRRVYVDPFDQLYPGFYTASTKVVGPWIFGLIQRGHLTFYVAVTSLAMVGIVGWVAYLQPDVRQWPAGLSLQWDAMLLPGIVVATVVCLSALMMPLVSDRRTRVLVLGVVGFAVTGMYYLYRAPDLAMTQLSIEIVSLVLFLLVLSILPGQADGPSRYILSRIGLSLVVGITMFWVVLQASVGPRPTMAYQSPTGDPIHSLGEFFLRNSHDATDTLHVPADQVYGGVADRGIAHRDSFGSGYNHDHSQDKAVDTDLTLHKGGGGNNVVNVILVDFRGFDTMGEVAVLGLAAMGVWVLLRRRKYEGKRSSHEGDLP